MGNPFSSTKIWFAVKLSRDALNPAYDVVASIDTPVKAASDKRVSHTALVFALGVLKKLQSLQVQPPQVKIRST